MQDPHRDYWIARATALRRKVNLGWWMQIFAGPLVIGSLLTAAALPWIRQAHGGGTPVPVIVAITGSVSLLALGCYFFAARRFDTLDCSLTRMDVSLRLHNALAVAHSGIAPWPQPVAASRKKDLAWNWPRLLVPIIGSLVLLAAGFVIPIRAKPATATAPPQPQAWQQLAAELDDLAKEELVDQPYIEETKKRLDDLKAQEEEQWFSHSSLEATDSLRESHEAKKSQVSKDLNQAANSLENFGKQAGGDPAARERIMEDFDKALEGLRNGTMKPNAALLQQLEGVDLKNLGQLSADQLQQLRQNLRNTANKIGNAGQGTGDDWADELLAGDGSEGQGEGEGQGGEEPGKGDVNRGPGHDPNLLGKGNDASAIGDITGLESKDLSRTSPGDLLELKTGEHDIDRTASKITQGGATASQGRGGEQIWKQSLDPQEQRAFKRYFD
ncbi:MAG: hypothetical protein V4733_00055 [Verrucomicrobiota bacterium]